jgi:hypothetical protein
VVAVSFWFLSLIFPQKNAEFSLKCVHHPEGRHITFNKCGEKLSELLVLPSVGSLQGYILT